MTLSKIKFSLLIFGIFLFSTLGAQNNIEVKVLNAEQTAPTVSDTSYFTSFEETQANGNIINTLIPDSGAVDSIQLFNTLSKLAVDLETRSARTFVNADLMGAVAKSGKNALDDFFGSGTYWAFTNSKFSGVLAGRQARLKIQGDSTYQVTFIRANNGNLQLSLDSADDKKVVRFHSGNKIEISNDFLGEDIELYYQYTTSSNLVKGTNNRPEKDKFIGYNNEGKRVILTIK